MDREETSALTGAVGASTSAWQADLSALFLRAKERFPDVVWLADDEDESGAVYAHKAIVYARAPPSFQHKYFTLGGGNVSAFSLPLAGARDDDGGSRSPSPTMRPATPDDAAGPAHDGGRELTRIRTGHNAGLLSKELEYLYTGRDFGDAFAFLFDEGALSVNAGESRVDKLRKDLVYMWRSRLYTDCRLALTSDSAAHKGTTAVFSTHRFVLVSRSDYFHQALTQFRPPDGADGIPTLTLPSPPFTPPALHFLLGYLYTGTLVFSNRTYDLDTALAIHRAASFLALAPLVAEIEARLVHEMLHGLYSAYLPFDAYDAQTEGRWGAGGCRCRQCARRAPRVLEFATALDSRSELLERGARRALVGLFGDGWCYPEFARLDKKAREAALKGVAKRSTPMNAVPLLLSANGALARLEAVLEPWADVTREMILAARATLDAAIAGNAEAVFAERDWDDLMRSDGAHFTDPEVCEQVLASLRRGIGDKNAAALYETVVSSVLLRPSDDDPSKTMLGPTSVIRQQVEECRTEIIRWLRKRWFGVRQEGGFDTLERWALQEIASEIEVSPDDLLSTSPAAQRTPARDRPISRKDPAGTPPGHSHSPSPHHGAPVDSGLRGSVLARNLRPVTNRNTAHSATSTPRSSRVPGVEERVMSSGSSFRSFTSTASAQTTPVRGSRADSKLGPSSASLRVPRATGRASPSPSAHTTQTTTTVTEEDGGEEDGDARSTHSAVSNSRTTTAPPRPRPALPDPAPRPKSAASVRSKASTVRGGSGAPSVRAPSIAGSVRSVSGASMRSTPVRPGARTPSGSGARTTGPATTTTPARAPLGVGARTPSGTGSVRTPSIAGSVRSISGSGTRAALPSSAKSTGPATTAAGARSPVPRSVTPSSANAKSTGPAAVLKKGPIGTTARPGAAQTLTPEARVRRTSAVSTRSSVVSTRSSIAPRPPSAAGTRSTEPLAVKKRPATAAPAVPAVAAVRDKALPGTPSATSSSLTVRRRGSADTIKIKEAAKEKEKEKENAGPPPPGATLAVGIPCIISSQRSRFRAYARYIGEVAGEAGPWVGVEVPAEALGGKAPPQRAWHDGSWGGVRYFELSGERAWEGPGGHSKFATGASSRRAASTKREASEALAGARAKRAKTAAGAAVEEGAESRGLFVRPGQVLYVLDASEF